MKYEKLFKAYNFFLVFILSLYKQFICKRQGNVPKLIKFFVQNAALKTTVIPLSTLFTRISAARLLNTLQCGAYLSNYRNLQLKSYYI